MKQAMLKAILACAASAMSLLGAGGVSAQTTPVTYTGTQLIGDILANYSITTPGFFGDELDARSDITSFSVALSNASGSSTITNANGSVGGSFGATSTSLFLSGPNDLTFRSNSTTGNSFNVYIDFDSNRSFAQLYTAAGFDTRSGTSPGNSVSFATAVPVIVPPVAGAVPEPTTWGMMILGMGAVGYAMRRRQKVTSRVSFA